MEAGVKAAMETAWRAADVRAFLSRQHHRDCLECKEGGGGLEI